MAGLVTAPGVRQDPLSGFRFSVDILLRSSLVPPTVVAGVPIPSASGHTINLGFKTVSGLEREVEAVEYREGNDGIGVRKLPGLVVHPNVTFERGISSNGDIAAWFAQVAKYNLSQTIRGSAISVLGAPATGTDQPQPYVADITITLLGRGTTPVRGWVLREAWPTKLTWEDLDAESSDILIETLEVAYAYMEGA